MTTVEHGDGSDGSHPQAGTCFSSPSDQEVNLILCLTALAENLGSVPSSHMAAHKHLEFQLQGTQCPLWASEVSRHTCDPRASTRVPSGRMKNPVFSLMTSGLLYLRAGTCNFSLQTLTELNSNLRTRMNFLQSCLFA